MEKIYPEVYHPKNKLKKRKGRGFSLSELKEAGLTVDIAKRLGIPIDRRRRTLHPENVELLKDYVMEEQISAKPAKKAPVKEKKKKVKPEEKVEKPSPEGALDELVQIKGLGKTSAEKLINAGIQSIKDLLNVEKNIEKVAEETGISATRLQKWIEEAKKLAK
ncbi:MAG: ribosomal protein L13e [Candidatus Odinarchaeia archaeon]